MLIKPIKEFIVGSSYFFDKFRKYNKKDTDYLYIMPSDCIFKNQQVKIEDIDVFMYSDRTKEKFIKDQINSNDYITVGKFIIPEFLEYIEADIDDISVLKHVFEQLDDKHKYELYIFECYISNKKPMLTKYQKRKAFDIYMKYR